MSIHLKRFLNLVSILTIILLFGCSSETSNQEPSQDNSSKNSLKIGVIGDFSSESVDMGIAMRNGISMAMEKFNAGGGVDGREVEIIFYDDEGDPTKATTGAQKLIEQDGVVALLGNPNTATSIASVKVSTASEVPQIVPIAQSPEVMEPFSPWSFRVSATNPMDIKVLIDYMKEKKWNNVGILYDTSAYGMSGKAILDEEIPKAGLNIVASEGYTVGAPDLTPQALNLQKANVDAILMWGLGADEGRFVSNVHKIGWDVPILGGRGTIFEIFTEVGGEGAEGTIATASFDMSKDSAITFVEEYENKYDNSGSISFAALGYDAASVLFEALKNAGAEGASDRKRVRDEIEAIQDFEILTGPEGATVSFSPDNHEGGSLESVVLVEHKDGEWVPIEQ